MGKAVTVGGQLTIMATTTIKTFASEALANDTSLELDIYDPSGTLVQTVANGSLSNVSIGVYWFPHVPTIPGVWLYRWRGSRGAWEDTIEVTDLTQSI